MVLPPPARAAPRGGAAGEARQAAAPLPPRGEDAGPSPTPTVPEPTQEDPMDQLGYVARPPPLGRNLERDGAGPPARRRAAAAAGATILAF